MEINGMLYSISPRVLFITSGHFATAWSSTVRAHCVIIAMKRLAIPFSKWVPMAQNVKV